MQPEQIKAEIRQKLSQLQQLVESNEQAKNVVVEVEQLLEQI